MGRRKKKPQAVVTPVDDNTVVITSEKVSKDVFQDFYSRYNAQNSIYSNVPVYESSTSDLTLDRINSLSQTALSNIDDVLTVNDAIRAASNSDDVIGMVVQAIRNNINTDYKIEYKVLGANNTAVKSMQKAKEIIDDFNSQIHIRDIIRQAIEFSYMEGTYVAYLRHNETNWEVDYIPLGIAEVSSFGRDGEPVVLFNIGKLKEVIDTDFPKTRSGKPLLFNSVADIIKNTYPKEVYDGYVNGDQYVVLDHQRTATIRVNNCGKKYGISPVFRAMSSKIMSDTLRAADVVSAKSKSKKIVHQLLREKLLDGGAKALNDMVFAHEQLVSAFRNNTVLYTSPAFVEKVEYVEPKTEDIGTDKMNFYRNQELASLGVSFLSPDGEMTSTVANINLEQLLKMINSISEQVSHMLTRFYRYVLSESGFGDDYVPTVRVLDAQLMDAGMRIELSKFAYNVLGASRKTTFALAGLSVDDEAESRKIENAQNLNAVFVPYLTSYVTSGEDTGGRPPENGKEVQDLDKKDYDTDYNRRVRE